ncbi:Gfo/Idh/MocA family protein [Spiroplasma culicicola]|uniref:Uncharacterized protein n=1 Tax=Spiroplasma culicicola AES-1 TaxID=1276246 RepID=W6A632_9MOLU|nr:Gfo/Idh/MocA family oxidoreductase [Spiroplasma culicicola]AHI52578.1 hypothetical protein SCULI_v1c02370 [Spiroplasma culicicola AES-1]
MNVIFIGTGRICTWFLKDIKHSKYQNDINVIGVYNRNFAHAQDFATTWNIKTVYQNYQDIVKDKAKIDLIYIGTPDETHFQYAKFFLENNFNVFCEKPIALSLNEAKTLYQIAQTKKCLFFDGIKSGLSPAFQKAKQLINEGAIGNVYYLKAGFGKISTSGVIANPKAEEKTNGFHFGGGVYGLYLAYALGGMPSALTSMNQSYKNNKAIASQFYTVKHQSGIISNIIGSSNFTDELSNLVCGSKGYLKIGGNTQKYNQNYKKDIAHMAYTVSHFDFNNNLIKEYDFYFETEGEGLCLELDHVYELLKDQKYESPIVTKEISLKIIETLEKTNTSKIINLEM